MENDAFSIEYAWNLRHEGPYKITCRADQGGEGLALLSYDLLTRYNEFARSIESRERRMSLPCTIEQGVIEWEAHSPLDVIKPFLPYYPFDKLKPFLKAHTTDDRTLGALNIIEDRVSRYRTRCAQLNYNNERYLLKKDRWTIKIFTENEEESKEFQDYLIQKRMTDKTRSKLSIPDYADKYLTLSRIITPARKKFKKVIDLMEEMQNPVILFVYRNTSIAGMMNYPLPDLDNPHQMNIYVERMRNLAVIKQKDNVVMTEMGIKNLLKII